MYNVNKKHSKFQINVSILTHNLTSSRLHGDLPINNMCFIEDWNDSQISRGMARVIDIDGLMWHWHQLNVWSVDFSINSLLCMLHYGRLDYVIPRLRCFCCPQVDRGLMGSSMFMKDCTMDFICRHCSILWILEKCLWHFIANIVCFMILYEVILLALICIL